MVTGGSAPHPPQCNLRRHPFSGGQKHTGQQSRYTCEHGTKQTHPLSNTTHASRTCCRCCCNPACDSLHLLYTAVTPLCWTGPVNHGNQECSASSKTESCTTPLHQLPKDSCCLTVGNTAPNSPDGPGFPSAPWTHARHAFGARSYLAGNKWSPDPRT
jgi:hypothetical protein